MPILTEEIGVGVIAGEGSNTTGFGTFLFQSSTPVPVPVSDISAGTGIVPSRNVAILSEDVSAGTGIVSPREQAVLREDVSASGGVTVGLDALPLEDMIMASAEIVTARPVDVEDVVEVSTGVTKAFSPGMAELYATVDDLKLVAALLTNGSCADIETIVDATGLTKEIVVFCVEWLVAEGLVAREDTWYCGLSSVKKMCKQLRGCRSVAP
jgi:hypothetical protein